MTPFGTPVDPEVKRIFATVSGPTAAWARSTASVGVVASQRGEGRRRSVAQGRGRSAHDLDRRVQHRPESAREGPRVGHEHHPGREPCDDVPKGGEVRGHQGVGGGDGREGHADVLRGQGEQQVLTAVAGKDRQGSIGGEPAVEERLAESARGREGRGVRERHEPSVHPRGEEGAFGRYSGPVREPLGEARRIGAQGPDRADQDRPVGPPLDSGRKIAEADAAIGGAGHRRIVSGTALLTSRSMHEGSRWMATFFLTRRTQQPGGRLLWHAWFP